MFDKGFPFLSILCLLVAGCGGNVNVTGGGDGGAGDGGSGATGAGTATGTGAAGAGTTGTGTSTSVFAACSGPGQCTLVPPGCCWPCGFPGPSDLVAVHVTQTEAYSEAVCPEGGECPLCESQPNPNVFAYCDAGTCQVGYVPEHPVSECTGDDDCVLRATSDCCEACGEVSSYQVTAVSVTADPSLGELVCAPDQACPGCASSYPPDVFAVCGNGHCAVAILD